MKPVALVASIALLFCACTPPASTDPATDPAGRANEAPATVPAGEDAATATAPADGEQAVDDAIDSNLGDHAKYQTVVHKLQQAVAAGDAAAVASLVDYPVSVDIDGTDTVIEDAATFVARYDQLMTPGISKAIVDTRYEDLFVNDKGVMLGDGQAWINGICKDDQCNAFDVKVVALQPGPDDLPAD